LYILSVLLTGPVYCCVSVNSLTLCVHTATGLHLYSAAVNRVPRD